MNLPTGTLDRLDRLFLVDLTSLRDSYFTLLIWSTVVVAVGVVMEGPEVLQELREEIKGVWRRHLMKKPAAGSFLPPWVLMESKPAAWIKVIAFAGWVLVISGIVGEGIFEATVSVADGLIQTFNGSLLAEARERAATANERAGDAMKEVAGFNARAKEAEAVAATARLELAKLKLPRTLSLAQQQRLIAKFRQHGVQRFSLGVSGDTESLDLLAVLRSIFIAAGWIKVDASGFGDINIGDAASQFGRGVILQYSPMATADLRQFSEAAAKNLYDEGIASKAEPDPRVSDPVVLHVLVGTKPLN